MSRVVRNLLLAAAVANADDDIILSPLSDDPSLPERLLIFLPGAGVPNEHYKATAEAIQSQATELRLHVVVPAIPLQKCIIACISPSVCAPLKHIVDGAVSKSAFKGTKPKEDTFVAGHSMGSICANHMVVGYSYEYAGLMEFGGYVDKSGASSIANYSIPVLHVSGELDGGGARPGKIAFYYQQYKSYASTAGEEKALTEKPVQILPGLDHSDFCPGFFVTAIKDIHSEVSQEVALASIGKAASAFLHLNSKVSDAAKSAGLATMKELLTFTESMVNPYLDAFALEQGPVCTEAQRTVIGVTDEDFKRMNILTKVVDFGKFEHSRSGYAKKADGTLELTCTSAAEASSGFGPLDIHQAAKSVDCKMSDATRVAEQLGIKTNDEVECSKVNEWAVKQAYNSLPAKSKKRFDAKGRPVVFKSDTHVFENIGPLFVKGSISIKETTDGLEVSSLAINNTIAGKIFPGVHYCKLLSPAMALEWMMTDGIKPFPYSAMHTSDIVV